MFATQALLRQGEFLQLGGEAEAVEEPEHQHGELGVGPHSLLARRRAEIVERLVDHRQADDRVDDVRIHVRAAQDTEQQRHAVTDGDQRHVGGDLAQPSRKKMTPSRNSRWS